MTELNKTLIEEMQRGEMLAAHMEGDLEACSESKILAQKGWKNLFVVGPEDCLEQLFKVPFEHMSFFDDCGRYIDCAKPVMFEYEDIGDCIDCKHA